ncbi:MAG: NAD(P)/FAD-dependent oxidoreductase [Candidatus Helarchaeota archaeon]|nr:NAD(P)/FAD-dependent oxidoreductase [Candidatus Helarchaeota archaeon]
MKYDIIVSGSGPAGSIAAKIAAENGLKTLVLERHSLEPRFEKPCGGSMPKLVFTDFNIPPEKVAEKEIVGNIIVAPNRNEYVLEVPGELYGWNVKRSVFDKYLCQGAIDSGAEVMENTLVNELIFKNRQVIGIKAKYEGKIKEFFSNLTIAADGVGSKIVVEAGLRNKWDVKKDLGRCAVAFVSNYNLKNEKKDSKYNQFYLSNEIAPNAYGWVFPLSGNLVNVGIGIHKLTDANPMDYLRKFINWVGIKNKFDNPKIEWKSNYPVPVSGIKGKTFTDGLIAVGDSAGFVSPWLGEGIYFAMWTGKFAAETAIEAHEKEDFSKNSLKIYKKKYTKKKFPSIFSAHKAFRALIMTDLEKSVNAIINLLNTNPEAQNILKNTLIGESKEIPPDLMVKVLNLIQEALR